MLYFKKLNFPVQNSEFQSFIDMNLAFVDRNRRRDKVFLLVCAAFIKYLVFFNSAMIFCLAEGQFYVITTNNYLNPGIAFWFQPICQ